MRSYFVGETTTTAIQKGDLLLLCQRFGRIQQALISHGEKAKEKGAALLLVTGNPESTLGKMADVTLVVKAPKKEDREAASIMPMGTLFEGGSCLVFENLVLVLMKAKNETSESMLNGCESGIKGGIMLPSPH